MVELNKRLIEQLREGNIALKNDGTPKEVDTILRRAFPGDKWGLTTKKGYFIKSTIADNEWEWRSSTQLFIVGAYSFLKKDSHTLEKGEKIELHGSHYEVERSLDYKFYLRNIMSLYKRASTNNVLRI